MLLTLLVLIQDGLSQVRRETADEVNVHIPDDHGGNGSG
jgi:hypothetical protein